MKNNNSLGWMLVTCSALMATSIALRTAEIACYQDREANPPYNDWQTPEPLNCALVDGKKTIMDRYGNNISNCTKYDFSPDGLVTYHCKTYEEETGKLCLPETNESIHVKEYSASIDWPPKCKCGNYVLVREYDAAVPNVPGTTNQDSQGNTCRDTW